jgi:hypothetical protein
MAILYSILIHNPNTTNENPIGNYPPQIDTSEWYAQLVAKTFVVNTVEQLNATKKGFRVLWFNNQTEFETWVNDNRLTDSILLSALSEWKTTHNITITEEFHEIPVYTPGISGIFG